MKYTPTTIEIIYINLVAKWLLSWNAPLTTDEKINFF